MAEKITHYLSSIQVSSHEKSMKPHTSTKKEIISYQSLEMRRTIAEDLQFVIVDHFSMIISLAMSFEVLQSKERYKERMRETEREREKKSFFCVITIYYFCCGFILCSIITMHSHFKVARI